MLLALTLDNNKYFWWNLWDYSWTQLDPKTCIQFSYSLLNLSFNKFPSPNHAYAERKKVDFESHLRFLQWLSISLAIYKNNYFKIQLSLNVMLHHLYSYFVYSVESSLAKWSLCEILIYNIFSSIIVTFVSNLNIFEPVLHNTCIIKSDHNTYYSWDFKI